MSDERVEGQPGASRRTLFLGAGAVGATTVLAACGSGGDGGGPDTRPDADGGSAPDGSEGTEVLVTADEVEVGGGVIISAATVVVTQPTAGTFRGFSAACTHEGCIVSAVRDGVIFCGCHGSQYSIEDGSVVQAAPGLTPQTQNPLPAVEVREDGGSIVRA